MRDGHCGDYPCQGLEPIGKGSVPIRIEVADAPDEDSTDFYSDVETRGVVKVGRQGRGQDGAADLRGGHRDGVRGRRPDRAASRAMDEQDTPDEFEVVFGLSLGTGVDTKIVNLDSGAQVQVRMQWNRRSRCLSDERRGDLVQINFPLLPYSYVVGQDELREMLEIAYVMGSSVGGVLLSGERGTAKSTIVRSFANMMYEQPADDPAHQRHRRPGNGRLGYRRPHDRESEAQEGPASAGQRNRNAVHRRGQPARRSHRQPHSRRGVDRRPRR